MVTSKEWAIRGTETDYFFFWDGKPYLAEIAVGIDEEEAAYKKGAGDLKTFLFETPGVAKLVTRLK